MSSQNFSIGHKDDVDPHGPDVIPNMSSVSLQCPVSDHHVHREDVRKIWKECQEESFWYRALPFSLGSMAVTGGLIYNGIWKSSKRFGPFPKLAVAGILGYAVGKASYVETCRSKFQELGCYPNRSCHHVCEECKKTSQAAPAEEVKS
uniref:OCIA domain containing 2 n=1 Tax=Seriola dumerili TaxID=41447 RepID=A0A3B4VM19_SERDU